MQCNAKEDNWVLLSRKLVLLRHHPYTVMYFLCHSSKTIASFEGKPAPVTIFRLKQRFSFSRVCKLSAQN